MAQSQQSQLIELGYYNQSPTDRFNSYQNSSDIGKGLLDLLYIDNDGFNNHLKTNRAPDPLEKYIIAFDEHLSDSGTIIALGNRLGFEIVDDEYYPASEQFIDLLADKINNRDISKSVYI